MGALRRRIVLLLLLGRFDEPELGGHDEIGHGAVNDQLVKSVFEQILFDGYGAIEIANASVEVLAEIEVPETAVIVP